MAFSKNDSKDLGKEASQKDYTQSSDGKSWIKNDGGKITPSESGGRYCVNGVWYTSLSDAIKGGRIN